MSGFSEAAQTDLISFMGMCWRFNCSGVRACSSEELALFSGDDD